ncbi:MAG: ABC transporter permease [Candidatus Aminicenantes bacterium]|nr:ABC transporter permease [Candidatus Aminicenantes bacterium]
MRFSECVHFALSNLRDMKLRTALTSFGVTVGIGALVAMVGFGQGLQKNVTESFDKLDLLNSITVLPGDSFSRNPLRDPDEPAPQEPRRKGASKPLDDEAIQRLERLPGVEMVFPEIRFPALVGIGDIEELKLVQIVPAKITSSKIVKLEAGRPFDRDDEDAVIISRTLLRRMDISDPGAVIGRKLRLSSLAFDFGGFDPGNLAAIFQGGRLPFKKRDYEFTVVGVMANLGFMGPTPLQSDIFIPPGSARRIEKLPFTNIWDLFRAKDGALGYSAVNLRLTSPASVDAVKRRIQDMGFSTFALVDQFNQIKTSFVFMDMVLAAVGMIAIFVAALGIINTMMMSILERYSEIGIMKAVGASRSDIKKIFFVESSAIGFLGGVFGLGLGWAVSRIINRVVNYFLAKQGIPFIEYFRFPWWLVLGAVAFAVMVSLVAGILPAMRAAKVDPVVALRHE